MDLNGMGMYQQIIELKEIQLQTVLKSMKTRILDDGSTVNVVCIKQGN